MMRCAFLIASWLVLLSASGVRGQNLYSGNPADPALLEAMFSNPALNAQITDRVVVALTAHQVGVAGGGLFGIRSGIITYHLPWQFRGAAAGVQYLSAGIFSRNDIRLTYGSRLWRMFRGGVSVDLLTQSFDQSKFFNVDPADPLLQGGTDVTALALGGGLTADVHPLLTIGLALQNLNRPDVALGDDPFRLPLTLSLGLRLRLQGASASSALTALPVNSGASTRDAADDVGRFSRFGVEVPLGSFRVRASTDANETHFEGEAPLYGHLFFNYRYAYPQSEINAFSSGTNRFGFIYDFNRLPPIAPPPVLPVLPEIHADIAPLAAEPMGYFAVLPSADSVSITELHVRRNVDPDIAPSALGLLFPEDLGTQTTNQPPARLQELSLRGQGDPRARLRGMYSARYRTALESIAMQMKDSADAPPTEVISYPGAELRADAVVNSLTGDRIAIQRPVPIMTTEQQPLGGEAVADLLGRGDDVQQVIEPAAIVFRIVPVSARPAKSWRLEIRDSHEALVREFAGTGNPPDTLVWNCRDGGPSLLTAGQYTFALKSVDQIGRPARSATGTLEVIHRHQSLSIDVTRKQHVGAADADKYILILGADPVPARQHPVDGGR